MVWYKCSAIISNLPIKSWRFSRPLFRPIYLWLLSWRKWFCFYVIMEVVPVSSSQSCSKQFQEKKNPTEEAKHILHCFQFILEGHWMSTDSTSCLPVSEIAQQAQVAGHPVTLVAENLCSWYLFHPQGFLACLLLFSVSVEKFTRIKCFH